MTINVKCHLTIGFPTAEIEDVLTFADGTSDAQIEREVRDWAFNYIEISHEIVSEGAPDENN